MITLVDNGVIAKYIGLSTDDKPQEISANIGMKNGSRFLEIDTGDKYYYDADSSQWMKQPSDSGGESGDDGSDSAFVINMTHGGSPYTETLDKTWNEIKAAYDENKVIILKKSSESGEDDGQYTYNIEYAYEPLTNMKYDHYPAHDEHPDIKYWSVNFMNWSGTVEDPDDYPKWVDD